VPFRDIAGHKPILKLLASAILRDSVPQSLLFSGPEGLGKFTTAIALAQAINCPKRTSDGDACGKCPSCTRIARRVHGDVLIVEPGDTGSIKIDQVRDALETVSYRPFEGHRRVVIIDQLEAADGPPQDALLKRLEEPTSASMFVLITAQPDALLPTVRSRCYQLRFAPLADADLVRVLVDAHEMSERDARALAAVSDGSVGRALARNAGELADARDVAFQLLSTAATTDQPARRLAMAKTAAAAPSSRIKDRDALAARLEAAAAFIRDMQVLAAGGDRSLLTNADMADDLAKLARVYDRERGLAAFAAVEKGLKALGRQANTKIVADWVSLNL
jgi:DNA polymerase III subunit delta'